MRIALIYVGQETNDFNPVLTTMDDYRSFGIYEGAELLEKVGTIGQTGGHYKAIADSGLEIETIPIVRAWAVAGGRITNEAFEFFQDKIRKGLIAAGKIDGLALQLHGACASEDIDDVEGEQIELCRQLIGPLVVRNCSWCETSGILRHAVTGFSFSVMMRINRLVPTTPVSNGSCGWVRWPTMASALSMVFLVTLAW